MLRDLPKGKYIVCGEAMDQGGEVYQESCFETRIRRQQIEGEWDIVTRIRRHLVEGK